MTDVLTSPKRDKLPPQCMQGPQAREHIRICGRNPEARRLWVGHLHQRRAARDPRWDSRLHGARSVDWSITDAQMLPIWESCALMTPHHRATSHPWVPCCLQKSFSVTRKTGRRTTKTILSPPTRPTWTAGPQVRLRTLRHMSLLPKGGREGWCPWPAGVLAYELLTGRPPFRGQNRQQVSQAIMTTQPKYPVWASSAAVDFMTKVLTKSAAKRPSMAALLSHPWITNNMGEDNWRRIHGANAPAPALEDVPEPAGVERSNPSVSVDPSGNSPLHRCARSTLHLVAPSSDGAKARSSRSCLPAGWPTLGGLPRSPRDSLSLQDHNPSRQP